MSRAELEAATGVPAFPTGPGEWWFALPGRGVTARGTDADGLIHIYAGDARGVGPAFTGRTSGGLTEGLIDETGGLTDEEAAAWPGDGFDDAPPDPGAPTVRRDPVRRLAAVSVRGKLVQVQTWSPAVRPAP